MALRLLVLVLLSLPSIVLGAKDCPPDESNANKIVKAAKGCPNNEKLSALCSAVGDGTEEEISSDNQYVYQTYIYDASCVNGTDSSHIKKKKINAFWDKYGKTVYCSNYGFNGSLIKFAVNKRIDDFIHDVTEEWSLDSNILNQPDKQDGRTVLDYVRDEMNKPASPALKQKLQLYYNKLQAAGAKHLK
jgi:hypothetical protein